MIQISGVIKDGAAIKVEVPWTTAPPGPYAIVIVTCDDSFDPTIIAESIGKALVIG